MPGLGDLKAGQAIWVDHYGEHPAVVVVQGIDSIIVICGTGQRKSDPDEVCIKPGSPAGHVLGLNKPTYFYPSKVAVVREASKVRRPGKVCPPSTFHALARVAAVAAKTFQ